MLSTPLKTIQPTGACNVGRCAPPDPAAPAPLAAHDVNVDLGGFRLRDVTAALRQGQVTALIGPNGSGKTTLLRALCRLIRPDGGQVLLEGQSIGEMATRDVARKLAVLPQSPLVPGGITVQELVALGRHPHRGLVGRLGMEDRAAVDWAMQVTGTARLADRSVDSLSGGERQRAWIAMALAQKTGILLLDEPTTYLDIRHQIETLALVRDLNRRHGLTVGWVLHDLNQAAAYSDHILVLKDGQLVTEGSPAEVVTPAVVHDVFGVDVTVTRHPEDGCPLLVPSNRPCGCVTCQRLVGASS